MTEGSMDAKQAQELVEKTWDVVSMEDHSLCCGSDKPYRIEFGNLRTCWVDSHYEAFIVAAGMTLERLEEIRQVEEEIAELDYFECIIGVEITRRIQAREQAALTALKQGMRA